MAQMVKTAGIDVSKSWLDVAIWPTREEIRVSRDAAGLALLIAWLGEREVARIGLEASGGYEREALDTLQAGGFEVALLNALRVRCFAKAKGRLAKNDRVDARTVAQFTAVMVEQVPPQRRRDLDELVELLTYRRQLKGWCTDCTNQLEHLRDRALRKTVAQRQAAFERDLAKIDTKLAALIAEHDDWSALARRLRTVPGVGPVVSASLVALLPELGTLSRRAIASLVGLAPFPRIKSGGRLTIAATARANATSRVAARPCVMRSIWLRCPPDTTTPPSPLSPTGWPARNPRSSSRPACASFWSR